MTRALGRGLAPLIVISALLSACVSLVPEPAAPPAVYRLTPIDDLEKTDALQGARIAVARPRASEILSGDRIAVLTTNQSIAFYEGIRWSDPTPVLVRRHLVDAMERAGLAASIALPNEVADRDFILHADLREFALWRNDDRLDARMRLSLRVVALESRQVVAAKIIESHATARDRDGDSVAAAMNEAARQAIRETVSWTIAEVAQAQDDKQGR